MRVLLINCSRPAYNLGLAKAFNWWTRQGADVSFGQSIPTLLADKPDTVWLSAIFSWDVPQLIELAKQAQSLGIHVEAGGCGAFGVREAIRQRAGVESTGMPDGRFEREPGAYKMVFWSRGCPAKNCSLGFPRDGLPPICSVPTMEGWRYTLYQDVTPARMILDNNLSALPRKHQELIVERTLSAGFASVDANSGFEPRSLMSRPWVVELWKQLPLVCWRFAYDEAAERGPVLECIRLLDSFGISRRKLRIYCLAGNEPIAECEARVHEINSWGAYPIVQRRRPLTWMEGPLPCLHDWTEQKLKDFQRWGNRLAKGMRFSEYVPGLRERGSREQAEMFAE
jgi:hypothetical protein